MASGLPSTPAILCVQVVQRVAVLGEDDDLPLPAGRVVHLGVVLEQLREFLPLAVLARGDDGLGLLFEALEDDDFGFELGDGLGGRRLVDEALFEVLLLLGVQVVVVLGDVGQGLGQDVAGRGRRASPPAAGVREPFLAAAERLVDGLRAGGEPPLEGGEGEADRPFARAVELVGLAHFRLDVFRDGLVQRGLDVGERVVDGVGLALREQRRAVELDQLLLHHPAHQVGGIDLVDAVAELAVEAVGVEQREEELEVLLLAVVRRGGHQQQVPGVLAEPLGEPEAAGLFELRAEEVGGELVGLVEDDQVPAGGAELAPATPRSGTSGRAGR